MAYAQTRIGALNCSCFADLPDHRLGESHVGVRLGDHGPDWTVLLNGEDVTTHCWEAEAGPEGRVWLYTRDSTGRYELCPYGPDHATRTLVRGVVQVVRFNSQPTDRPLRSVTWGE